jgi:hypothetical protein
MFIKQKRVLRKVLYLLLFLFVLWLLFQFHMYFGQLGAEYYMDMVLVVQFLYGLTAPAVAKSHAVQAIVGSPIRIKDGMEDLYEQLVRWESEECSIHFVLMGKANYDDGKGK